MRKLNYLLMGLFVATATMFTACSEDDEAASAEITYSVDGTSKGAVGAQIQEKLGAVIDLNATFLMGSNKLAQIKVALNYDGSNYSVLDSLLGSGLLNSNDKTFTFKYSTVVAAKAKTLTLTAIDSKGLDTSFVVKIVPTAESIATGKVNESTATILGGKANATYGSLYSFYLGQVIKLGDGKAIQSSIDMVYYNGATNKASLSAPSAADAQTVYSTIAAWTTKNATKFAKLTGVTFANINSVTTFNTAYPATIAEEDINQLAVGDVLAIKTVKNQKAIVEVKAINTTTDYITVNIKTLQE